MRIRLAEAFLARLPLRLTVRHALASRRESANLLVRLVDEEGHEGWGEGVPRPYVTGEEPGSAFATLSGQVLPRLAGARIDSPAALLPALELLLPAEPGTQSSRAAAELALLDLAGRAFGRSAASWFGGALRETVRYSGVLPLLEGDELEAFLGEARAFGIAHLKVKAEGARWGDALAAARRVLGPGVAIAVDANGSWGFDEAVAQLARMEPLGVAWVEQPLPRGRESEIPALAGRTGIPLMADESLTTEAEAESLIAGGGYRLFNLRVSKLGGIGPARRIAGRGSAAGVAAQVGCMVGETSILSAAGRLLAALLPAVAALEGSYGVRMLETDVSPAPFTFGAGGWAHVQQGPGLGVEVVRDRVLPLAVRSAAITG